jgi:hypothetical protein
MTRSHPFFAAAFSLAFVAGGGRAQSEAAALGELSALPIASITAGPQRGGAPVALCGRSFVVTAVEASAYATVYTLEGVDDGTSIGVEIAGRDARRTPAPVGAVVTATATSTGTVLATPTDAIAFIPNALGRALLGARRTAL